MSNKRYRKVYVKQYAKVLAKKHGLTKKQTRELLTWMTKNLCKMIEDGQTVRIKGFGRFYFKKPMQNDPDRKNAFRDVV